MADRTKAPEYKLLENIEIPKVQRTTLENGINFHYIQGGNEEVIRLIVSFRGGSWVQKQRLVAASTSEMLTEGTKKKSSVEISEIIDFYGANLSTNSSYHYNTIVLNVLTKHLEPMLRLLSEMLTEPTFPEDELKLYLNNEKQDYIIDLERVERVARNLYHEAIFGYDHPYGTYAKLEDFDKVERQMLVEFHRQNFIAEKATIVAAGKITDKEVKLVEKYLKDIPSGEPLPEIDYPIEPSEDFYIYKEKNGALQSALLVGKETINMLHPDYLKLNFVTTLLGGYFGSRLMTNIRQEKGYTYGINAYVESYLRAGALTIEASVKKQNRDQVIEEIGKEVEKLKTDGASEYEISIVKNYVLGQFQRIMDGILASASYYNRLLQINRDFNYINEYVETIKKITNEDIKTVANRYFDFDNFYKVIIG